ncbi:hypothetical protein CGCF415_v004412 [Colletotrichum fructicola]|uniref:Het domain protein n=1 Tax=Colletotrichum fructicola (strain Nara gc5) TaxID=1213859 RepID=L2FQQ9_COLFN|nr:uncharacterized protein CGMCC3_g2050 [Colletotrichum fructicola]KAE9582012.1 hypothetical protein CGMCC3_g2050 [Colletotrichum fructicola]KAF4481358.1 hypothetical protein CGGC5_v011135 [Colletotrichum fructicola Nara gc5]KAF4911516.1 hypothetical protein CGCF415_v004412 [Colletotrichum fructicola]KAF4939305.1 hypothetical protein CGCF245_v003807 [Colletotrichum fructicola]
MSPLCPPDPAFPALHATRENPQPMDKQPSTPLLGSGWDKPQDLAFTPLAQGVVLSAIVTPDEELPTRLLCLTTGEVVTGMVRGRYAIISYCWQQWPESSSLIETVSDVLEGTGIDHVWIDQRCIEQGNMKDKAREVPRMGDYYKRAALCVALIPEVASLGTMWSWTQPENAMEQIFDGAATATRVVDSVWGSRVWTFQEAILSERLLIFNGMGVVSKADVERGLMLMRRREALTNRVIGKSELFFDLATLEDVYHNTSPAGTATGTLFMEGLPERQEIRLKHLPIIWHSAGIRACSVVEDHVYGYLSLCSDGGQLPVQYGVGLEKVLVQVLSYGSMDASILSGNPSGAPGASWQPEVLTAQGQTRLGRLHPLDRQQHLVLAPDGSASVRGLACRVEVTEEELGEAVISVQKQRWTLEITRAWLGKMGKTFGAFGGLIVTPDPESEGGEFLLGEGIVLLGKASIDGAFHRIGSLVVLWSGEIMDETKEWRIEATSSPVLLGP